MLPQVNRLDRDNGGLRAENNRLATILAERQPLVVRLRDTIEDLREVSFTLGVVLQLGPRVWLTVARSAAASPLHGQARQRASSIPISINPWVKYPGSKPSSHALFYSY